MLLDHHRAKIVQPDVLAGLLGQRPRERSVVMCHGVFDVVHPGHLRHLLYAKSKAPILVCSLTADRWISKGPYRPHVPESLRAANLALLDIVDYVVIDDCAEPSGLIARIRPDIYAKGFEYSPASRPRRVAEAAAVEAYGGEVLFTPGDVVYSSSALIERDAPDLRWDKLAIIMRRAELTFDALRHAVAGLRGVAAHIVGDSIVDVLTRGEMIGANAKTPTMSVRRVGHDRFVGGAAIVALHARAAGAQVQFSTILGDDWGGEFILTSLQAAGVDVHPLIERARPTTIKEAIIVDGYRLLKIDTVDNRPISDGVLARLCDQVGGTGPGRAVVVFSDFRHGIFNARTIPALIAAIPRSALRVADSQVASRWGNILQFEQFDLIAANEREARFALGDQDSGVRPLAVNLYEAACCSYLLLKLGARGMLGFAPGENDTERSFALDSFVDTAVDAVGAGDALLAYGSLALTSGASFPAAAIIGALAAAAECEYDGNIPITPDHVLAKIDAAERGVGAL